jgi:hypothetical protein
MKIIAILLALVALAMPAKTQAAPAKKDSASVAQYKKNFLAEVVKAEHDPKLCKLTTVGPAPKGAPPGTIVHAVCDDMPRQCLFVVHPKKPVAYALDCQPNPNYVEPGVKIDRQL